MIKIEELSKDVLSDLHEAGYSDAKIEQMTVGEAFNAYCVWHGLIGWSGTLFRVLSNIIGAAESHWSHK